MGKRSRIFTFKNLLVVLVVCLVGVGGFFLYKKVNSNDSSNPAEVFKKLEFSENISEGEKQQISNSISEQAVELSGDTKIDADTRLDLVDTSTDKILQAYIPVVNFNSIIQKTSTTELHSAVVVFPESMEEVVRNAIVEKLSIATSDIVADDKIQDLSDGQIAIIPLDTLSKNVKLLTMDDKYYLDSFDSGAIFRIATVNSPENGLSGLKLNSLSGKDQVFKVNMTGVTALTRLMQRKLAQGADPTFFSAKIGDFLADADLTHVSNEVSFKPGCSYSNTVFCSPPAFIETLKASGVDLVELTGNHNNDTGAEYNTSTIELYRSLGWGTVGGGLNNADAAKPFVTDQKGSNITFLAYNFPDSPNGGAISGVDRAGANSFDFARIETDIATAKANSDFVIVDVQYWECYSYPDGYVEFPLCDSPTGEQEPNFKKLVELGADMVIGSSAHQPQYYEFYKGKPIYYGLGNLYFEQTQWPGTERGIILTHYFVDGELLQTKLTPTVYDKNYQTRKMTDSESDYFLGRLHDAQLR